MTNSHGPHSGQASRRDFLRASTGAVLGAGLAAEPERGHGYAAAPPQATNEPHTRIPSVGQPTRCSLNEIARLESEDLVLQVYDSGTFGVTMKRVGCRWLPDPWQGVACRVTLSGRRQSIDLGGPGSVDLSKDGGRVTLTLNSAQGVSATTCLALKGNVVHVAVRGVALPKDAKLVSVQYPFRSFYLRSGKDRGYLAVPSGEGCLIPSGPVKLGNMDFFEWHDKSHGSQSDRVEYSPTMPFYGAQKDGAGYTAILETPNDFVFHYLINSDSQHTFDTRGMQSPYVRIACAWPVWLGQKGELGYERRMRFEFSTGLDYVGMAKAYRKEAIARRDLITLREKSEDRPQIAKLAGAPYLSYYTGYPHELQGYPGFEYTYKQLGQVIDDLTGPMGLRRALIPFKGCYSVQPPGCLPFDTTPGPIEDLQAVVGKAKKAGLLFFLYNDISAQLEETDWWKPELMWKTSDGKVRKGNRWGRTCSSQYMRLLSRDLPQVVKTLGVEGSYIDCINAGRMNECYDPRHPLTRSQDREARMALYEYIHSLGLIFGGEHAGWWNPAALEFTNGVGTCASRTPPLLTKFQVPLYQLVFHDALVPFAHPSDDYTLNNGAAIEDKVLRDLLRGIPPMFFLNLRDHNKWRRKIIDTCAIMSDPAAAVMYDEMLTHKWLTDDQMVARTRFSSGVEITVNFDEIEREGLPGKGFCVLGVQKKPREGNFAPRWEIRG